MQGQPRQIDYPLLPADEQTLPIEYYNVKTYEQPSVNVKGLAQILRRRWLVIVGVATVAFSLTAAWTLTRKPTYQTAFQVLVQPIELNGGSSAFSTQNIPFFGGASSTNYKNMIEVMRSPQVLNPVASELQKVYPEITYDFLAQNLSISEMPKTDIIGISFTDTDPDRATAVSRQLMKAYLGFGKFIQEKSIKQGVQFVDNKLPAIQDQIRQLELTLQEFRKRYGFIDPEARGSELSQFLNSIVTQRQTTATELTEAQTSFNLLSQQLGYRPEEAITTSALSESPRYQALLGKLQVIETEIAEKSATYQPDSPQMATLLEQRQSLLPLLSQEAQRVLGGAAQPQNGGNLSGVAVELNRELVQVANEIQTLEARSQALAQTENRLRQDFTTIPALARQYEDLKRQLKFSEESLARFLSSQQNLEIEANQKSKPWQVLFEPTRPSQPISPNIPRNLGLGLLGSLVLGVGAAYLLEKLDDVFHSSEELKRELNLPLLTVVPFRRELSGQRFPILSLPAQGNSNALNIKHDFATHQFLEAFRGLHASLHLLSTGNAIRSLVITSALPAEGKTTVSTHLALAAAAMGQKVLLVDGDLRRPQIHQRLNVPNLRGFSNAIAGSGDTSCFYQQSPIEPNLYVLTAGQTAPDPTRLFASEALPDLMKVLQEEFDMVIYDTPPLTTFTDSALIAKHTDGCMMVVGLGHAERSALSDALERLRMADLPIIGMVINCIRYNLGSNNKKQEEYYERYYSSQDEIPVVVDG